MSPSLSPDEPAKSALLLGVDLSSGGGVNKVIRDLSDIFATDLGISTTVVSARSAGLPSYAFPDEVKLEFPAPPARRLLSYIRYLFELRRRRYDVAVGFWTQDNILLTLAFLFSRTRVVLCEHISHFYPPWGVRVLRRLVYPLAAQVTVLNREDLAHYQRFLRNVALVPNPVPEPDALPDEGAREQIVLGVGHLIPLKGFDELVSAFAASGLASAGWRLVLVGDGPERSRIEASAAPLPEGSFEILPPTPDIAAWFARASIIAVPSRIEGFSLVLVEGIIGGAAPLAYAAAGPSYILEDVSEQLVPIGDVETLAAGLVSLAPPGRRSSLVARARQSILRRMSRERVAALWREIILD
jgi:glycosyltransferase involved in cell wall biosynthesis